MDKPHWELQEEDGCVETALDLAQAVIATAVLSLKSI